MDLKIDSVMQLTELEDITQQIDVVKTDNDQAGKERYHCLVWEISKAQTTNQAC